ncbi:MAG TPA: hypothetical protein ENJ15_00205, partial [Caldithrix abyssi]|nr:hypothetical protein [Caldithrix abyssi]
MAFVQKLWFSWDKPAVVITISGFSILVLVLYHITWDKKAFQKKQARVFFAGEMLPLLILPAFGFLQNPLFPLAFLVLIVGSRFLLGRRSGFQLNAVLMASFLMAVFA